MFLSYLFLYSVILALVAGIYVQPSTLGTWIMEASPIMTGWIYPLNAVTSISIFIFSSTIPATTIVAAGRMLPKCC